MLNSQADIKPTEIINCIACRTRSGTWNKFYHPPDK